jgi:hypothetical protein
MMSRSGYLIPAVLALALVLPGCSRNSAGTGPQPYIDQEFADEIAQHVGMVLAAGNGGSMLSLTATATTLPTAGGAVNQIAARPARDTVFAAAGVAWALVDTFFTANGTPQADYDSLTSTRVAIHALGTGQIHRGTFNGTLSHRADLQGSGLSSRQDTLVLAGTAHDSTRSTFVGQFSAATIRLLCVSTITHQGVTVLKRQDLYAAPLGGFSDWTVAVTRFDSTTTLQVQRQETTQVLIGFDGTNHAVLQVGGLYDYQVDLTTGALTRSGPALIVGR